jgi:hypothetical protein
MLYSREKTLFTSENRCGIQFALPTISFPVLEGSARNAGRFLKFEGREQVPVRAF